METKKIEETHRRHSNRVFIWLFVAAVFAVTLAFQIYNNVQQTAQLNKTLVLVKEENQQAKTKQIELQTYVDLLNNDEYVLKLARERGFYSLTNEIIFNITEQNSLLQNEQKRQEALLKQGR